MVNFFKNISTITLITSLLASCAGITAGKVKLENYPEIKKEEVKKLNINYKEVAFEPKKEGENFNHTIGEKLQLANIQKSQNLNSSCVVEISSNNDYGKSKICQAYGILAGFTLFIVPAYCYWNYQAHATLISTKDNKVLKTYDLKDKVHEVWSSLWMISWFVVKPNKYAPNAEYPKDATKIVEETISEALVRSILNDAKTFPECQK